MSVEEDEVISNATKPKNPKDANPMKIPSKTPMGNAIGLPKDSLDEAYKNIKR